MRSTTIAALLTTLVFGAGCERKSKNEPGPGTPKANDGEKPEAVSKADLRPPVASDLADYSKDLPGTGSKLMATIETPLGTLHCELYGDKVPMTVANFVGLATGKKPWRNPNSGAIEKGKPFFDGLIFHRVIPEFMIQGGDPKGQGNGGPGYQFDDEFVQGLEMSPGTLAMANAGPGTNGSQFFVMEGARPDLVGHHTIFGKCAELDVVQKITHTPTTDDRPNTPVTMKITISKG
jgi:peptidyl-prolyl cis-trans isomerase A (cyclophilin A)